MIDLRAHVVTADITYRGHVFQLADDGTARILDRGRDAVLGVLCQASATSRDGQVYDVVGVDADGNTVAWRAVKACARCSAPSTYPTPAYDIPTVKGPPA